MKTLIYNGFAIKYLVGPIETHVGEDRSTTVITVWGWLSKEDS